MIRAPAYHSMAMRNAHLARPHSSARSAGLIAALAASLTGCGDVKAPVAPDAPESPADAPADPASDTASDAPLNRCATGACLLVDEFDGANLNPSLWGVTLAGGATARLRNGILSIRLPAAVEAFADVYSLVGFGVDTTFMASVTFTPGQFYDHKGVGFSSSRITTGCDAGESDAVMFRGQDDDAYIETKTAHVATCSLTTDTYPAGQRTLRITRLADQVMFRHNGTQYPAITTRLPTAPLPVRFSAYTYTNNMPAQPVQIDIDWVLVTSP
jgi:hypothetical protein